MSTEQPQQPTGTSQLLTLILTELRAIKAALQSGGRQSQPPARPPANRGSGNNSGGNKYAVKSNEEVSTCRDCGENIVWRQSRAGNNYCVNMDGNFHSETCTGR
jgi:hypothetical protein